MMEDLIPGWWQIATLRLPCGQRILWCTAIHGRIKQLGSMGE